MADMTLVLKVGYRGSGFAGYAEQNGQRTVATELRRALEIFFRRPCELTCAGRTDAGVHALAQYVSLPVTSEEMDLDPYRLWRSCMAITPEDISIRGLYCARQGFSARFDALSRSYVYRIACGNAQPVLGWQYVWWQRNILDVVRMHEAAQALRGEHDFRSFCKASSAQKLLEEGRSTSRRIDQISVCLQQEAGEEYVVLRVKGNAFLHNMVRIIVGSLVEVGKGSKDPEWIQEALMACDRRAAGPTAPPRGLVLSEVTYPEGMLSSLV